MTIRQVESKALETAEHGSRGLLVRRLQALGAATVIPHTNHRARRRDSEPSDMPGFKNGK